MNKVILMGRLTRDPEVRYTQTSNTLVASFSLAVNRRFARQGEERQADFINIVAWMVYRLLKIHKSQTIKNSLRFSFDSVHILKGVLL